MGITAAVLAIAAGLVGLMVWTALLFPLPTARAGAAVQERPWRCFGSGIGLGLLIGGPVIVLLSSPNGAAKLAGWGLSLPLVALMVVGLTAMAQVLGERMQPLSPAVTPLGGLVRGAVTMELAMLPPFLGWFVFAPLLAVTVLGAGALGCLRVRQGSTRRQGDTGEDGRERARDHSDLSSDDIFESIPSAQPETPSLHASVLRS